MLLLITRRIILLMLSLALGLFVTIALAPILYPIPAISINDGTQSIVYDSYTHVTYTMQYDSRPYHFIMRPVDGETDLYLEDLATNEQQFIAKIPASVGQIRLVPDFSEQRPAYVIARPNDAVDEIEIYTINIDRLEMTTLGTYPFSPRIGNVFPYTSDYVAIYGGNEFLIINRQTGESFSDETTSFAQFHASPDTMSYQKYAQPTPNSALRSMIYLLDLTTFESEPMILPDDSIALTQLWSSSPSDASMLLEDADSHLWIYHADTEQYTLLPQDLRPLPRVYAWRLGDASLVLGQRESDETRYVLYDLATGQVNSLFPQAQTDDEVLRYSQMTQLNWTSDLAYLLVWEQNQSSPINYQIYDAQTGEVLVDRAYDVPANVFPRLGWYIVYR